MARKPGKSETLTIRLDPKIRFMLEFVSRVKGQTITTVVERAINDSANNTTVRDFSGDEENWRSFWSISEGERALKMYGNEGLHPTFEEERRKEFASYHWPFFYTSERCRFVRLVFTDILWPRIDEFIELHEASKTEDYYAAGKAMQEALSKANVKPPDWPVKRENAPAFDSGTDNDDIPF